MSYQVPAIRALAHEADTLTELLAELSISEWNRPTPAPGWSVKHQVAHLVTVYQLAASAAKDPQGFRALLATLSDDFEANVAAAMAPALHLSESVLLETWRRQAADAVEALAAHRPQEVLPWLVNDIPAAVLAMAGAAEAFAHGQDIRDVVGAPAKHTDHIRAVCEFAYHTRQFGYLARGKGSPADSSLRFELVAPSGAHWQIGDPESPNAVIGSAWDLALLVTRRRHRMDLDLQPSSAIADAWIDVAQAYRGPAGKGRQPGQFVQRRSA